MRLVQCDVAVVGGGPAGSVVAATLAARGARVVLLDGSHPREKPCGGGFTGRALALVRDLLPSTDLPGVRVDSARFTDARRGREAIVPLPDARTLVVSSRRESDRLLFAAAASHGASIVAARVVAIEPGRPHTLVTADGQRLTARWVIGADGTNSFVRRQFTTPFTRAQLSVATGVYAHGVSSREIVLELVDQPAGYIWSFPRPDHLAIGICAQASDTTVGAIREHLTQWLTTSRIADGARLEPYSWPIPSLSAADFTHVPLAGDGWITVGDAAGLVDPITREGIYFALQSALMAADALGGDGAPHVRYTEQVREEIGADLAAAAALKAGFFQPRFTRLLLDALNSSTGVRSVIADLVAGTQPYRTIKRRLLGTMEFGLAWKWLRSAYLPA